MARSCEINPNLLHRWRRDFQQSPEHAFSGLGRKRADENRVTELERKIGQLAWKSIFLVTTDSRHGFPIYPNLAGELQLTDVNQLWIADITYVRLEIEFVYLAVVLDAFSRRVIGWALDRIS